MYSPIGTNQQPEVRMALHGWNQLASSGSDCIEKLVFDVASYVFERKKQLFLDLWPRIANGYIIHY